MKMFLSLPPSSPKLPAPLLLLEGVVDVKDVVSGAFLFDGLDMVRIFSLNVV